MVETSYFLSVYLPFRLEHKQYLIRESETRASSPMVKIHEEKSLGMLKTERGTVLFLFYCSIVVERLFN